MIARTIATLILSLSATAFATDVQIGLASNFSEVSPSTSNPYGDFFRKGIQLAVKDSHSELEKANLKIQFQEFDYGTNQLRVTEAAKKAAQSSVIAVVGYNLSPQALLAAPVHQGAKLPMLTSSATANRLSTMGRYIHMTAFDNEFMGKSLARIARSHTKAKKVAIIVAEDCAYCHDLANAFEKEFTRLGGESSDRLGVLDSQHDFSDVIAELKKKPVDAILVPNYELPSVRIVAALTTAGINKPFLGGDGWGDIGEEFFKIVDGKTVKGYSVSHWHPDLTTKVSLEFKKNFYKAYQQEPNDTAVLAYDSMKLLITALLKTHEYTREGIEDSLNSIHRFAGVTGKFLYPNKNESPEKSIVVLTTDKTRFKVLDVLAPDATGGGL